MVSISRTLCASLLLASCARQGASSSSTPPVAATEATPAAEVEPAPAEVDPEPNPAEEVEPTEPAEPADPPPEPTPADPSVRVALTDAQADIFFGTKEDAPAEFRGGVTKAQENKHYLAGNEKTLQIYHSVIKDLGGGYMGVGTDQAYLFMSWARSELGWLIDYDAAVIEVHELYRLFFAAAQTPEQMVALWDKPAREEALAIIEAAHQGRRAKSLRRWYLGYRGWIHRRLATLTRTMKKAKVPTYLTDQEHYDYIRQMLEQRRIRPMVVNLHESKGLRGIAEASKELGVPIRLVYLSNAEEYWPRYPKQYRKNMAAMPFDDDAILLRTLLIWKVNTDYRYNVQRVDSYLEWLAQPYIDDVYDITHARPKADPEIINFFETTNPPDESPSAKRWRKAQEEKAKAS